MKILSLLFFVILVLSAAKHFKIFDVDLYWIVGLFILWFVMGYIKIHMKNKERRTPKPVYIATPPR